MKLLSEQPGLSFLCGIPARIEFECFAEILGSKPIVGIGLPCVEVSFFILFQIRISDYGSQEGDAICS